METPPSPWLTPAQAAEYLRITVDTLNQWRRAGLITGHRMPGGRIVRYRADELDRDVMNPRSEGIKSSGFTYDTEDVA